MDSFPLANYWKTVVAVVAAVGAVVAAITNDVNNALADNSVTSAEWWFIGIAVVNAVGVYAKRNVPPIRQN